MPPTDVSQLPAHIDPAQFNFTLAWIEYVNRLAGVAVGLLILGVGLVAWQVHRQRRNILWPAVGCMLLVAFQGWFGGQVVAYELDPRFVTVHLVLALILAGLLLHLVVAGFDAEGGSLPRPSATDVWPRRLAVCALGIALVQTLLGALVRGSLEILFQSYPGLSRGEALDQLGPIDELHKAMGVLTLLMCGALYAVAHMRLEDRPALRRWAQVPAWIAITQFAAGQGLASQGLPPLLQLLHLIGGSLLFGSLALVALLLAPSRAPEVAKAISPPMSA